MAPRFCRNCQCTTETEHNDALGHVVCTGCGEVMEENAIVAEVGFMENSKGAAIAEGFSMGKDKARVVRKPTQGGSRGKSMLGGQESRETTIQNGHRRIQDISYQPQVKMHGRQCEQAQRFFNLAVINNFTKGRKLNNVAAACLYIVCRTDKTAHMLIDFADALSTNVYQLGATFLKLVQVLHLNLPLVDPALYISRFAARLDFEDQTSAVIRDANRLVARMNRDWIEHGRRPAGICAACLFVAARMNGFKRTKREIAMVVKICEATLNKRLQEFSATPSASLSVEQFQTIWLPASENPPAFENPAKRRRPVDDDEDSPTPSSTDPPDEEETELLEEMSNILGQQDTIKLTNLENTVEENDGNLSELDDDPELQNILSVTEAEAELKEILWTEENKDWILKQQLKALDEKGKDNGSKKKRQRKPKKQLPAANSPAEATRNLLDAKPRASKKINYEVIDNLFEIDVDDIKRKQANLGELGYSESSVTGFGRQPVEYDYEDDGDGDGIHDDFED
ncbi:cyclin-like protein [Geranomyces variabilis]|nr:cyclin-like protein [Geranomyces variabilis]KAJ3142768.1 transcription factor TFIIIB subunit brf1 [Geranomyces variabilis]